MKLYNEVEEKNYFLVYGEKRLYTVLHIPKRNNKKYGIILCRPIWGERIRTHRIYYNLSKMLSSNGYTVISCDYHGDGNSSGETMDLTFDSMIDDVKNLYDYLVEKNAVEKIGMMGLLIGANVAIEAEKTMSALSCMVLFEPLLKPIDVFKRSLRANLSSQMVKYKKIVKNREALIEDLRKNIPVNIDGFIIGKKFWESFERATPLHIESNFKGPVLVYSLTENGKKVKNYNSIAIAYRKGKYENIEKEFIWDGWKYYKPNPNIFFETLKNGFDEDR